MKEMMKNRTYRDKIVYCAKDPKFVLIQMVDEDMIDMLSEQYHIISSVIECPFLLAGYVVNDWNKDLSPWKAKAVFGKKNFEGAARETLDDLSGRGDRDLDAAFQDVLRIGQRQFRRGNFAPQRKRAVKIGDAFPVAAFRLDPACRKNVVHSNPLSKEKN